MESPSKSLVELKFVYLPTYLFMSSCLSAYLPSYLSSVFFPIYLSTFQSITVPAPQHNLLIQNLPWEEGSLNQNNSEKRISLQIPPHTPSRPIVSLRERSKEAVQTKQASSALCLIERIDCCDIKVHNY